jgi:hypothetical protein
VIHSSNRTERISASPFRRTAAITQPEQLTQRKSKRPIEGLACIAWLSLLRFYIYAVKIIKIAHVQTVRTRFYPRVRRFRGRNVHFCRYAKNRPQRIGRILAE